MTITLKPYSSSLDGQTVKWLQMPKIRDGFGFQGAINLISHKKWVKEQKDLIFFGIFEGDGQKHIGNVLLHAYPQDPLGRYLQIYIGDDSSRGRGYGMLAMKRAIEFCTASKIYKSIYLHVYEDNIAATRLYENLNFQQQDVEAYKPKGSNQFKNQILYLKKLDE